MKKSGIINEPCKHSDNLVDQFGQFVLVNQIVISAFQFPLVIPESILWYIVGRVVCSLVLFFLDRQSGLFPCFYLVMKRSKVLCATYYGCQCTFPKFPSLRRFYFCNKMHIM